MMSLSFENLVAIAVVVLLLIAFSMILRGPRQ